MMVVSHVFKRACFFPDTSENLDLQAFYSAKVVSCWRIMFLHLAVLNIKLFPSIRLPPMAKAKGSERAKQLMSGRHPVLAQAS